MNEEIFGKVKELVIDVLDFKKDEDKEKVVPEARFREDLGADSLDLVELIMAFEDSFHNRISDEDARGITTVGDAVTYIEAHLNTQK